MLNCLYYIFASSELLSTNYLDRNIAKTIIEEINYYQVVKNIIRLKYPNNYKEDFLQKDWHFFNEEQLVFEGNNLFICIY